MDHVVRRLLLALIAFAFIGGASSQSARSAQAAAPTMMAGMPCDMMAPHAGTQDGNAPPCKGMSPDCKQMCCVGDAVLPARTENLDIAAAFSKVDYWSAWFALAGFVHEPEPLPPRTA